MILCSLLRSSQLSFVTVKGAISGAVLEAELEVNGGAPVTAAEGAVVNNKSSAVHASEEQLHCNVSLHT